MNKKVKRIISKSLIFINLFSNVPQLSFAGTLSEDTRYETFESSSIKIDDILEEDEVDVEVKGNTLVNINTKRGYRYAASSENSNDSYTKSESVNEVKVKLNKDITSWNYVEAGTIKPKMLKPNTEYTVIFEKSLGVNHVRFQTQNGSQYFSDWNKVQNGRTLLRTYSNVINTMDISVYCYVQTAAGTEIHVKNAIVVEGNYLDDNIDYFEGMKSVGQNDSGNHSIKISSQNKNLFDGERVRGYWYNGVLNDSPNSIANKNNIPIKPSTTYTFYVDGYTDWIYIAELDKDLNETKGFQVKSGGSFTTTEQGKSLRFCTSMHYPLDFNVDVQIEEGSVLTDYTQHSLYEKEIALKEPLRGLPNGVKDRIVKVDGKWYIERNCKEVILDGSEAWIRVRDIKQNTAGFFTQDIKGVTFSKDDKSGTPAMSALFTPSYYDWLYTDEDNIEMSYTAWDGNLCFSIFKSKLPSNDVDGFKKWLSTNKPSVVYQLATPIYEPLNIDSAVNLYLDTTHISNESTIPAKMKVVVDRVANRAKEFSEIAKANPTIENISAARMWSNLMRDSMLKDTIQDGVNSIISIKDFELGIEKKESSVNADLYIKPQNVLSMSLNTNSIIFEEYSNVESLEMPNAININVQSSLPYDLNVYMPSQIYNSDKTDTLKISTLNIKEGTENTYKAFTNTIDKLVLKSNCDEGKNKNHSIDLKLNSNSMSKADVYKTVLKFEIEQR